MRKQTLKIETAKPAEVPNQDRVRWNDRDIREFLMDSHPDFQEEFIDSPDTPPGGAILVLLLQSRSESNLADPTRYQKNANLSAYWKLFVQKSILGFEQALFPLLYSNRTQR